MLEPTTAPQSGPRVPLLLPHPPPPGGGQITAIDDVNARHVDEWVIMRVTAYDGDGWPSEGFVIAHDLSEERCWDAYRRAVAAGEPRAAMHHVFVAGPKVCTGAEMQAAIERLQAGWQENGNGDAHRRPEA